MTPEKKKDNFDIVVLNFADSKLPVFKELRNKDFIYCGEKNDYPEYLVYQYNKCGTHRAIINGKSKYILGGGLEKRVPAVGGFVKVTNSDGSEVSECVVNDEGETMYDILQKSIKDVEIHGGFRWLITRNRKGEVCGIYHRDFYKFRTHKEGNGFLFKESWFTERGLPDKEDAIFYPEFTNATVNIGDGEELTTEVFAYNEYGPGSDWYPLPEYVASANYIDIEIEIGKFHLSSIRNGMMPSKMIQFYTGDPTDEKKKQIEKRFKEKFAGSENAGKFILIFNSNKDKQVDISDLSFNELDKQFELLQKTCDQKIFTGHQVTSPMLFGIKTEGQLGGSTELKIAYEVFINTYAKPKQQNLEKIVNYFGGLMGKGNDYYFTQLDPVGIIFDIKDVIAHIPVEYILEKIGIPKEYRKPLPAAGTTTPLADDADTTPINPNIRALTGKDWIHIKRLLREHKKGDLPEAALFAMLKSAYGLSEDEIRSFIDKPSEDQFKKALSEDEVLEMFSAFGDNKSDFDIVKSKRIKFSSNEDAFQDELNVFRETYKGEVTATEASILDLISKDKRVTPEVIAETLGTTAEYVKNKIESLVKRGLLKSKIQKIGGDEQIERELTKPLKDIQSSGEAETTEILIKYSYEGPQDSRNRPFCAKLLKLDRLYSRMDIEKISERLGYSVWDRRGGWWTQPDGERSPSCRHYWQSNIVTRKKGGAK